jgi:uncharacterized membrane protein
MYLRFLYGVYGIISVFWAFLMVFWGFFEGFLCVFWGIYEGFYEGIYESNESILQFFNDFFDGVI